MNDSRVSVRFPRTSEEEFGGREWALAVAVGAAAGVAVAVLGRLLPGGGAVLAAGLGALLAGYYMGRSWRRVWQPALASTAGMYAIFLVVMAPSLMTRGSGPTSPGSGGDILASLVALAFLAFVPAGMGWFPLALGGAALASLGRPAPLRLERSPGVRSPALASDRGRHAAAMVGLLLVGGFAWALLEWTPVHGRGPWDLRVVVVLAVLALVVGFLRPRRSIASALALGLGPLCFAVLRLIGDLVRDPTSHNLWPLELMFIAIGFGVPTLLAGVTAKLLTRYLA